MADKNIGSMNYATVLLTVKDNPLWAASLLIAQDTRLADLDRAIKDVIEQAHQPLVPRQAD